MNIQEAIHKAAADMYHAGRIHSWDIEHSFCVNSLSEVSTILFGEEMDDKNTAAELICRDVKSMRMETMYIKYKSSIIARLEDPHAIALGSVDQILLRASIIIPPLYQAIYQEYSVGLTLVEWRPGMKFPFKHPYWRPYNG